MGLYVYVIMFASFFVRIMCVRVYARQTHRH